ncbi:glycoside hydrolase family 38 C-terminal domain-containing protein [Paenibacillus chondroitinus]|uniref:Glycoside hydrolase family 38 C-terminal domain-containing protein n=1 Tax=Paenibacillus chondroitinus TaxID=59842 RepID=A0ABU6DD32_9BACL|nr:MULTISPECIES: glycosyl hydrolase-related protein [Paenibacillus]MCY9662162.1 glycosyl hydrolase-related protein [Paenibacillus anseongense]MEB4795674.1 glycoside hydrolase family 38 C-terminal domain-containing protein [Paenibacillus chondroitinus]
MTLEKIYVVFKTHFDIGFTGLVSDVVGRYRSEMLKDVIEICDQTHTNEEHEKYVWTMSAWPLLQSLKGSQEEEKQKALAYLENRQLIWHKLPYTTHTEFCGLEEWIRGMYVSEGLTNLYGYDPKDAKMTDVPGHTWVVPSLLKKAGVEFLHLGCNPATTPPDVPPVFYWEGPDGERLLTFYSKGSYGTGILPPEEWTHPVWLAMIQTSDNHGPHDASIIEEMKASIRESGSTAELHIGSLGDFAADFLARNPELPVIRGDMADSWIHGVGTAPREVARVRALRSEVTAVESAVAVKHFEGAKIESEKTVKAFIDESYEHTLLFGEHTWGMDCKTFLFPRVAYDKKSFLQLKQSERYQRMEQSWAEQVDYLNKAESSLHEAKAELTSGQWTDSQAARALRVHSNLGWSRAAKTWIQESDLPADDEVLVDAETGEAIALKPSEGGAEAYISGLPALGYKTLNYVKKHGQTLAAENKGLARAYLTETQAVIENPFIIVKVDRNTGWVQSLWDKKLRKEWIDDRAETGFGQYKYDIYSNKEITRYLKKYAYRFYDWGVHDFGKTDYPEQQKRLTFTTQAADIQIWENGGSVGLTCKAATDIETTTEYGNASSIEWTFSLTEDSPYLDVAYKLHAKQETPLAESGHIVFPLKLERPQYSINKLGSVVNPLTDTIRSSSTLLHCCEHFVDISNGFAGMAIIPLDSPLFFIGKNGMWDFEHAYKPEQPELYFNVFNNWWGTNFPQWSGGDLHYRFRLVPHAGDWREGEVWKVAQETMTQTVTIAAPADELQTMQDILPAGLDGMAVSCWKVAENGQGCILRIRECTGVLREVEIVLPEQVKEVRVTNLLERDQDNMPLSNHRIRLITKPFEVHTFRIIN